MCNAMRRASDWSILCHSGIWGQMGSDVNHSDWLEIATFQSRRGVTRRRPCFSTVSQCRSSNSATTVPAVMLDDLGPMYVLRQEMVTEELFAYDY